jgi:TPR repeat protein
LNESLEPLLCDCCLWPTCDAKRSEHSSYVIQNKRERVDRLVSLAQEEVKDGALPTKETDIYEFGCLFYLLLKRRPPVAERVPLASRVNIKKFLNSDRVPPTDDLPEKAKDFVKACWNVDPSKRLTIDQVLSIITSNPTDLGFPNVDETAFREYAGRFGGPVGEAGFLTQLAEAGSAAAAFFLGRLYETGDGVEKDADRALELYRRSGEGNNPFGNERAGSLMMSTDVVGAVKYLTAAASIGNGESLNELGQLTESGRMEGGVEGAAELYGRSALQGSASGLANYRRLLLELEAKQAEKVAAAFAKLAAGADAQAEAELRTAAAGGSPDALFALGWLAEAGRIGGDADALYREAADKGSTRAQNSLGVRLVRSGRKAEGYELINRAARALDPYAMNNIASAIESGEYEGDIRSVAGVSEALENYAAVVGSGIGIAPNPDEAQ